MKTVGELKNWEEVREYFSQAEKKRFKNPNQFELDELNAKKRFRMNASFYAPAYDLAKISLQRVLVDWYQERRKYTNPIENLQREDEIRLYREFKIACDNLLGRDWESVSEFLEIEEMRMGGHQMQLDASFGVINPFLDVDFSAPTEMKQIHRRLIRNWTNPNFPLWLMTKSAISGVIDYWFGAGAMSKKSVGTTLERMKLHQLKQQPIRSVVFDGDCIHFKLASYLPMEIRHEFKDFQGSNSRNRIRLDGSHFLKNRSDFSKPPT